MRDTSTDFETGWVGQQWYPKSSYYDVYGDLSSAMMGSLDAFSGLSSADLAHLAAEAKASAKMAKHLDALSRSEDPVQALRKSAVAAMVNEMNPRLYGTMAGLWPVLRGKVSTILSRIGPAIAGEISKLNLSQRVALLQSIRSGGGLELAGLGLIMPTPPLMVGDAVGGFSVGGLIGDILKTGLDIGGKFVLGNLAKDTQEELTRMQLDLQRELADKQLAAQKELAEKQLAAAMAAGVSRGGPAVVKDFELPGWVIPVAVGGAVLFFILRK